jgi:hypothetical protein
MRQQTPVASVAVGAETNPSPQTSDVPWPHAAGQSHRLNQPGPVQNPNGIDLNHLTDQVIQAIDRRLIAQRERVGRI